MTYYHPIARYLIEEGAVEGFDPLFTQEKLPKT